MTKPSRVSGILLHPTCLPGPHGSGDLGAAAFHFVDWLVGARQSLWQILPLGGIGPGNSPYMSSSAFAGNILLIDLHELHQRGWLESADLTPGAAFSDRSLNFAAVVPWRRARLEKAARRFSQIASGQDQADLARFQREHADWLDDYTLFMALADAHDWRDWSDWPTPLAQRDHAALQSARTQYAAANAFWTFCQWCFFRQWQALKTYANRRGIKIVGDIPIFIAAQSAEVWARQDLFELDAQGRATVVAGVPPDYFSATGQRWGNPLYRWAAHARENYVWWVRRIRRCFELVDWVRIDHFRGFVNYWEIPATESTAIHGQWRQGPGAALFEAIQNSLGDLPIIAEDLGLITPDVIALRNQLNLPGMAILHFAFDGAIPFNNKNAYLPHNLSTTTVVYTGTHDNNTTQGWWADLPEPERSNVRAYLGLDDAKVPMHWPMIRAAFGCVADTAIHPLQDVLGLGADCRMNLPGVGVGYWQWRFTWAQVQPEHAARLAEFCQIYSR